MLDENKLLCVHENDNVLVCVTPVEAGYYDTDFDLTIHSAVPRGHKVAKAPMAPGEPVIKYGFPIGVTTAAVAKGEHLHSHNMKTSLSGNEQYGYLPELSTTAFNTSQLAQNFLGYRRENGTVGIRNEIWIINSVGCVNRTAELIASECQRRFANECDGFKTFSHPFGCSQLGDDLNDTRKILAALASHPNAGAVLVVGLGCENNQLSELVKHVDKPASRIRYFNSQDVSDEVESGVEAVFELLKTIGKDVREPVPVSELVIGMKCGGSDALSGLTANPVVGRVTDLVTANSGSVLLTETPEMFGAEKVLMARARNARVFEDIVSLVNAFKQYFIDHNQPVYENPSPGNKAGGLTTLEEKSLGAIQKGGLATVEDVLDYGMPVRKKGLSLLQAPGNDAVSSTALAASGAHIVLFTTGRGTPLGFPVPTLKIASNSHIADKKPHWIDFNAGRVVEGTSIDDCARELYQLCIETASGKHTCNERNGSHDIAIWKRGVTL